METKLNYNKANLFILVIVLFLLYPIIAHILMYQLGILKDNLPHGDFWELVQIFLSAPVLLLIGLFLFLKRHSFLLRMFGIILILVGIYWGVQIVSDLLAES
jgi:hypothetical protein